MKKALSTLSLIAALLALGACAATDLSGGKSRYKSIDVATAKSLHERNVIFIDVRSKQWFDEGHIPGAVNIPFGNLNDDRLAKVVSKDQEVVFYCYGIQCELSNTASNRALIWGYQKVYLFQRGFPGWFAAGYPIEQ